MENPFSNYNPYDLLEELARQNKELHHQLEVMVANQHAIAHSLNASTNRLNAQGQMINRLLQELQQLKGELNGTQTRLARTPD